MVDNILLGKGLFSVFFVFWDEVDMFDCLIQEPPMDGTKAKWIVDN